MRLTVQLARFSSPDPSLNLESREMWLLGTGEVGRPLVKL